jgi:hypothetical protein
MKRRNFIRTVVAGLTAVPVMRSGFLAAQTSEKKTRVAVLKHLGSNEAIMNSKIFEVEQIKRAVELSLGISGPGQIELVAPDDASRKYADTLKTILAQG